MLRGCCDSNISFYCSAEAEASVTTVLKLWENVALLPQYLDNVKQAEIVHPGECPGKVSVGLKWREERLYMGRRATMMNTITKVDIADNKNDKGRTPTQQVSFSYNSHVLDGLDEVKHMDQVGSLTIIPIGNEKSLIILTVNAVARGWYGCMIHSGIGRLTLRCLTKPYFQAEVNQYAVVAEKMEKDETTNQISK